MTPEEQQKLQHRLLQDKSHQKEYENTCKHTAVIPSILYGQEGLISNPKPSQKERWILLPHTSLQSHTQSIMWFLLPKSPGVDLCVERRTCSNTFKFWGLCTQHLKPPIIPSNCKTTFFDLISKERKYFISWGVLVLKHAELTKTHFFFYC